MLTNDKESPEYFPVISIIVPVFNAQDQLERCVRSLCSQSYRNLEIILVDDGSSDRSAQVIRRLEASDERIRILCLEHAGANAARLAGVKMSSGEWTGFIDADDSAEEDMYEKLLHLAVKNDADIAHCGYCFHRTGGKVSIDVLSRYPGRMNDPSSVIKEMLSGREAWLLSLCNKLFRKELFDDIIENDIIDKSIDMNEDLLLNYYLFRRAGSVVYTGECLYNYIEREGSAGHSAGIEKTYTDHIKVRDIIRKDASDDLKEEAEMAYLKTCIHACIFAVKKDDSSKLYKDAVSRVLAEQGNFHLLDEAHRDIAWLICASEDAFKAVVRRDDK